MVIKQRKLFWQIFLVHLLILLLTIILVAWYSFRTFDAFYIEETGSDLENRANLVKSRIAELLIHQQEGLLQNLVIDSGRASGTRITVILPDGTVVADTYEDPAVMDNHRMRPEIDIAFSGRTGRSMRFSNTLGERLLYVAIPLHFSDAAGQGQAAAGQNLAVLRMSMPVTAIDAALRDIRLKVGVGTMVAIIGAFVITYLVSKNISRPLEDMTRGAEQYARGNFSQRMLLSQKKSASKEIASLAAAMDQMAGQLDDKINTIISQRNQLEAVFSSMVEAVIAVDREERIISINDAAAKMFGVDRRLAEGRLIQEAIRNVSLQEQVERILKSGVSFEDEIILESVNKGATYLQTNAVSLQGGDDQAAGALIVLNDITRLRKLESMRSDFVANVSHELKTPITSIRGYVETLLDGALDDREDSEKFLDIVLRQSGQLEEIIDDLLALSRIERHAYDGEISFAEANLKAVLEEALGICTSKAADNGVEIVLDCPEDLTLTLNQTLLEQAVVNLLINAVTYSESGQQVIVQALETETGPRGGQVEISVIDHGIGIAEEHLPRLFERFYRSDRARSRKAGGTGLGLAIVKHIVQAHHGRVAVQSTLGKGSTFTIILPST